jgi:hypothetical protein
MTPKYYTPEISEFCIGFEYEVHNNDIWEKQILEEDMIITGIGCDEDTNQPFHRKRFDLNRFRVKHLDREDIQECEWELRTDENKDIHNPEYTIGRWYFKTYPNGFCTIYDDTAVDEYCFRGIIKNKSELKKLMVQLGIN